MKIKNKLNKGFQSKFLYSIYMYIQVNTFEFSSYFTMKMF